MTTFSFSKSDTIFSVWLLSGLWLYVAGFYLAPSSKAQYLTLYIGLILPALYFSFRHFRAYYLSDNRILLWILLALFILYLPSLWADSESTLNTLRKNLKGVLFVLSLAVAIKHASLHYPRLITGLPWLIVGCTAASLVLFYAVLAHHGINPIGNMAWGNLADNPNETGLALSAGLVCLTALMLPHPRWQAWLLIVPLLAAIYLAYSRSAMLGLAVALPFAVLFAFARYRLALVFLGACLTGGLVLIALMASGALDANALLSRRPALWMDFFAHNPGFHWLWGAGMSESVTVYSQALSQKLEPHGLFFALGLRGGLLALATFGLLVLFAVRRHGSQPGINSVWLYLLIFGLVTQGFEGVYPIRRPNSFWLYTWLPLLILLLHHRPLEKTDDNA